MDLSALIQTAKGQYGLERSGTEDSLFTDAVMKDFVNSAHRWFAGQSRCYAETKIANLATGVSAIPLAGDLIELDIHSVRIRLASLGTWKKLPLRHLKTLMESQGPPEAVANAAPIAYYLRPGSVAGQSRVLELFPAPNYTQASSLSYLAYIYPPALVNNTDTPILQEAEHDRLIPVICWHMALAEAARGRADAPIGAFYSKAQAEARDLFEIMYRGMHEPPRTANVGLASGHDALERRGGRVTAGG